MLKVECIFIPLLVQPLNHHALLLVLLSLAPMYKEYVAT